MNRILVVDDDRDIVELLEHRLRERGYEVQHVIGGAKAVEVARDFQPHLVLLDVMLGDALGYHVARELRKHTALYKVPILFQSSASEELDIQHALEQGGDGYLVKPYTYRQLLEQIEAMWQVWDSVNSTCPITGLGSLPLLKKHLDHRLFRREDFALIYVHMGGLKEYHRIGDASTIDEISRVTANQIKKTIRSDVFYETTAYHLGGGYFMAVTPGEDYRRFTRSVKDRFKSDGSKELNKKGITPLYTSTRKNGKSVQGAGVHRLASGAAHSDGRTTLSAAEMVKSLQAVDKKDNKSGTRSRKKAGYDHWVG